MSKAKTKQLSQHSRAARRQESPVDKSLQLLTDAAGLPASKPKASHSNTPSVLQAHHAGIEKKKKKHLTHQQRVRQEHAMERADAAMDKLEKKVAESKRRGRRVQERRKEWEATNGDSKAKKAFAALVDGEDVEMDAPTESLASLNASTVATVGRKPVQANGKAAEDDTEDEVE